MKHTLHFFFILSFVASTFISCSSTDKEKLVTIQNKYTLSVPSILIESKDLNDEASLQYENQIKELYVMVIDEPKDELHKAITENSMQDTYSPDITGYTNLVLPDFIKSVPGAKPSDVKDTLINNMPAKVLTLKGVVNNIEVFYYIAIVEGKKEYYQVLSWTTAKQEKQYADIMKRTVLSLREL